MLARTKISGLTLPQASSCNRVKMVVQPKLAINKSGDVYEQEADAMAERVMGILSDQEFVKPITGLIGTSVQRKCSACEEDETKKKLLIRKIGNSYTGIHDSPTLVSSLNASKGWGSPLPQNTRSFMEHAFSADFSGIRVHADDQSAEMSKEINANAFTLSNDIYFNRGQYNPSSTAGKHLLAHELTHTMQQHVPLFPQSSVIQRDLAVEPTAPDAVARELTPAQIQSAIRWNQASFADADEISLLRDILGISAEPGVIDEEFVTALVRYQANFRLTQDGLLGAGTARRLADELQKEADYMGTDADVGSGTEMALSPARRRMRLRSRVVSRLGRMLHQGFIGPRDNPTGIVTVRSGFTNPLAGANTNSIGINYTGNNPDNSRWLQFVFLQLSAINPATRAREYRTGAVGATGGIFNFSDAMTFHWGVDTAPAAGNMYYEAGFTAERVAGAHTEIFDQPVNWNGEAESYAASFASRPSIVRLIAGFNTYLVINNNSIAYHVRWNMYFNFNTTVTPTPDVTGTYEVLVAGSASRLPAALKTALDTRFPGNTVP